MVKESFNKIPTHLSWRMFEPANTTPPSDILVDFTVIEGPGGLPPQMVMMMVVHLSWRMFEANTPPPSDILVDFTVIEVPGGLRPQMVIMVLMMKMGGDGGDDDDDGGGDGRVDCNDESDGIN